MKQYSLLLLLPLMLMDANRSEVWGVSLIYSNFQTGSQLTTNPDVSLYESPSINGSSLDWAATSNNLIFLMEWSLLPAQERGDLVINIQFDYTPLTGDNDIMFGLHDGTNIAGWERSDNSSGSWWTREGLVSETEVPAAAIQTGTGLGPVDPFTITYTLLDDITSNGFSAVENGATTSYSFLSNPVDEDEALTFWIGRQSGESYRLNSLDIQVVAVPEPAFAVLALGACALLPLLWRRLRPHP